MSASSMHANTWNLVPERVELSRVDHNSLTTNKERVFIPGNKILMKTIALVWLNELVKIGFSESESIRSNSQSCHQGGSFHESFTKHHLVVWLRYRV